MIKQNNTGLNHQTSCSPPQEKTQFLNWTNHSNLYRFGYSTYIIHSTQKCIWFQTAEPFPWSAGSFRGRNLGRNEELGGIADLVEDGGQRRSCSGGGDPHGGSAVVVRAICQGWLESLVGRICSFRTGARAMVMFLPSCGVKSLQTGWLGVRNYYQIWAWD